MAIGSPVSRLARTGAARCGILLLHFPRNRGLQLSAWLFVAGIVLFAGSLYVVALTGLRGVGAITPFGGVAFLAGWAVLAWSIWRDRD